MNRTRSALSVLAVAGLLTLMGCSSDSDDAATTTTAVTVDGTDTDINPDKVYCSGEEGNIGHIIGKTNDQPPLVEATPGEFAMVKTQKQGAPYKAENPTGITFGDKSATFDNVTMGAATVSGDLVCTDWED